MLFRSPKLTPPPNARPQTALARDRGLIPAYLSYMLNGKRPWRKDLYRRYMGVVNSDGGIVNTLTANEIGGNGGTDWVRTSDLALMKRPL